MTAAEYQQAKDGYPDVDVCAECGVPLRDDEGEWCKGCDWDLHGDMGGEEQ